MKATFAKSLLVIALSAFTLTACNKNQDNQSTESPPAPTESTTAQAQSTATSASTSVSPTVQIWVESMKLGTFMMLKAENPNLTAEQLACLRSDDANATYYAKGEGELKRILGDDLLKAADEFYASEFGKKITAFTHQQLLIAAGETVDNPITLTPEEQADMLKQMQESEFAQKMQADAQTVSEEEATAMIAEFSAKEKARCNL